MEKVKENLREKGFYVYENSFGEIKNSFFCMVKKNRKKFLLMEKNIFNMEGEKIKEWFLFKISHALLENLRKELDFLNPKSCGNRSSFGFGDRLGITTPAHIDSFKSYSIFPFLAQQSIRELERTGRNMEDVIDDASLGCLESGYKGEWGADADHLKSIEEVKKAEKEGFTMFTLDISDFLNPNEDIPGIWKEKEKDILRKTYPFGKFTSKIVHELTLTYWKGLEFVKDAYYYLKDSKKSIDIELSIDESGIPTTPYTHIFILENLRKEGVELQSLAPCFPGRFEKGIDYKGNLREFEESFKAHSEIARYFGGYRLSLHSGSDKLSIYRFMKPYLPYHVKTSGTSWLEAVFTIAEADFPLFKEIFNIAKENYQKDRLSYSVSASLKLCPAIEEIKKDMEKASQNHHLRQIFHVTYGSILKKLKKDIIDTLLENEDIYYKRVSKHLRKHIVSLF